MEKKNLSHWKIPIDKLKIMREVQNHYSNGIKFNVKISIKNQFHKITPQ